MDTQTITRRIAALVASAAILALTVTVVPSPAQFFAVLLALPMEAALLSFAASGRSRQSTFAAW